MANWYGSSRSNYFRVKDEGAFREWVYEVGLEVLEGEGGLRGIAPSRMSDSGDWPTCASVESDDPDERDERDVDIANELSTHLAEGEVAVLLTIGAEKLRYLTGYAVAVNWKGEIVSVGLDDIYAKAFEAFGIQPTYAEY